MNKKSLFYLVTPLLFFSVLPYVKADVETMVLDTLSLLFGTGYETNFMILKFGVFAILFAILFKSAEKLFLHNKAVSTIVALIISVVAVRFMPEEAVSFLGPAYALLGIILLAVGIWLSINSYFPMGHNRFYAFIHAALYSSITWFLIVKLPEFASQMQNDTIANLMLVLSMWGRWVFILLTIIALYFLFRPRLLPEERERLRREREIHGVQIRRERAEAGERRAHEEMMRRQMEREDTLERRKFERVQRIGDIRKRREEEERLKKAEEERTERRVKELKREEQLKWNQDREGDRKLREEMQRKQRIKERVLANIEESREAREASKYKDQLRVLQEKQRERELERIKKEDMERWQRSQEEKERIKLQRERYLAEKREKQNEDEWEREKERQQRINWQRKKRGY